MNDFLMDEEDEEFDFVAPPGTVDFDSLPDSGTLEPGGIGAPYLVNERGGLVPLDGGNLLSSPTPSLADIQDPFAFNDALVSGASEGSVLNAPVREQDSSIGSLYTSRQSFNDSVADTLSTIRDRRESAVEEAQDINRSGASFWGSMLSAIIPTIAGAALGGKEGALIGGQAGFAGAYEGIQNQRQDDERRRQVALKEAENYAREERDLRSADIINRRQERQNIFNAEQQRERLASQERVANQRIQNTRDQTSNIYGTTPEANQVAADLFAGRDVSPDRISQAMNSPANTRMIQNAMESRGIQFRSDRGLGMRGYDKAAAALQAIPQGGEIAPGQVPVTDPVTARAARDTVENWQVLKNSLIPKLRESLDSNNVALAMSDMASLVVVLKNLERMGANFTEMERNLIMDQLPDPGDRGAMQGFMDSFRASLRDKETKPIIDNLVGKLSDRVKYQLGANRIYLPGESYSPQQAQWLQIELDENGRAIRDDSVRRNYERMLQSGMDEFGASEVMGERQGGFDFDLSNTPASQINHINSNDSRIPSQFRPGQMIGGRKIKSVKIGSR